MTVYDVLDWRRLRLWQDQQAAMDARHNDGMIAGAA